jgi:hypothetical protein
MCKATKLYTLADVESVAAVVAEFYGNRKAAQKFYEMHGDSLSGFPGVWRYVAEAALVLEKESAAYGVAGEDYDWLLVTEDYAPKLYAYLSESEQREAAREVLAKHSYSAPRESCQ